jgi:hypothetical protein
MNEAERNNSTKPDDILIRACHWFMKEHAQYIVLNQNEISDRKDAVRACFQEWCSWLNHICNTPAASFDGLKAKASIYRPASLVLSRGAAYDDDLIAELNSARSIIAEILLPTTILASLKVKALIFEPASLMLNRGVAYHYEEPTELNCARSIIADILRLPV